MSSLYEKFKTDEAAEEDGQWVEVAPNVRFKIRSSDSTKVREASIRMAKERRPKLMLYGGMLPPKYADEMEIKLVTDAIVADWDGVEGPDGKALPFTKENLRRIVTDLPHLRREIIQVHNITETYKAASAAMVGNSLPASPTTSGSEESLSES